MNKNLESLEDQTCEWEPSLPNHPFHEFFDLIGEVSPTIIDHSLGYSTTNPFRRPDRSVSPDPTPDPFVCASLTARISIPSQRMRLDISQYFQYSQTRAAKLLCVSKHALCKSWRKATNKRKWPHRKLKCLDLAIETLEQNMKLTSSPSIEQHLKNLLQIREAELSPVMLTLKLVNDSKKD